MSCLFFNKGFKDKDIAAVHVKSINENLVNSLPLAHSGLTYVKIIYYRLRTKFSDEHLSFLHAQSRTTPIIKCEFNCDAQVSNFLFLDEEYLVNSEVYDSRCVYLIEEVTEIDPA